MLERIIRILSAFESERPTLSVATLANRAEVPVPTCYRLVNQMIQAQLLRKDESGNIGLGMRLWELASRSSPALDLRKAAMPFLDDVQSVFRQHTQLSVIEGDEVLVLERLSSRNSVVNLAHIASRMPIHPEAADYTYPETGNINSTLANVRQHGYAQLEGLIDEDTTGAAVPVFAALDGRDRKKVIAAIGVVVPRNFEQRNALIPVLLAASRGLTRSISGQEPQIYH